MLHKRSKRELKSLVDEVEMSNAATACTMERCKTSITRTRAEMLAMSLETGGDVRN